MYLEVTMSNIKKQDLISYIKSVILKYCPYVEDRLSILSNGKSPQLDVVLNKYIDDYFFRKELKREMKQIRIRKDEDKLTAVVNWIIKVFDNYEVGYTRNIYYSRWI